MVTKNEFYNGIHNLKASGVEISYTSDQVDEFLKCSKDPIYFIKNYVKVVHVDRGVVPFALYPYQERLINGYHNNRKAISIQTRQSGKCTQINTTINIKNKQNDEVLTLTIGEFHELCKRNEQQKTE